MNFRITRFDRKDKPFNNKKIDGENINEALKLMYTIIKVKEEKLNINTN